MISIQGNDHINIVSLGEIVMDLYPSKNKGLADELGSFIPEPGGANANVAAAAAKLGTSSAMIGKVGRDNYGQSIIDTLTQVGVDTRGLRVDDKLPTTLLRIAEPEAGSFRYRFKREGGADLALSVKDLDEEMIKSASILHCCSLLLTKEETRKTQYKAIELVKNSGGLISVDVNHRPGLWPDKNDALIHIQSLVRICDILKVNETELEILTGTRDPGKGIPVLLAEGVNLVAVTLGEKGCQFATKETCGFIPAYKVIEVDPLGCGDAFTAGMLVKIVEEKKTISNLLNDDLVRIFKFANAVGALTSTRQGTISSFPERPEVEELISRRPL
jgi:sugar/nucleoside kinase (ribokinase family)